MGLKHFFAIFVIMILLAACSTAPPYRVERMAEFQRPTGELTLYFVPFHAILAPNDLSSELFNRVVDSFDSAATEPKLTALIFKRDLASVDKGWLGQQYYVTGDVFAYDEETGCCSTEIKLTTRLLLYQPGTANPVLRIDRPYRILFNHDQSTLEAEKERMLTTLSKEFHRALAAEITPR